MISQKQAAKEMLRRSSHPTFDIKDYLFDKQLEFVLDPAPFKIAVTTRRAGKTVSCAADLIYTAINTSDCICVYITLSRSNAKRIVWPELKRINRRFKLQGEFNESELSVTFQNGSIIYCSGASDRTEIEKFRGLAIKKAYLDEGQSFPAYIRELVDDVLGPALMDYAGTLCLIGTPGPIPTGYFYEIATTSDWSKHTWSFFDNPKLDFLSQGLTHQDVLIRELKRRGVSPDNPSIQREWFGKWVLDSDSLVYKFDSKKNTYEELPKGSWNYILGVDIGFDDADALCVLAWSNSSNTTYLVEEQITRKQGLTELVSQIDSLRGKYPFEKIVMDQGGLGKKIAEEIIRRYKIAVEPAEKNRKLEYIELMNDALRTGTLKCKKDSTFASDALKVEWDMDKSTPDKMKVSNRFHSDICDAVLYAWRASYAFTHSPEKVSMKYGSKEWAKQEEEDMFNREVERLQDQKEKDADIFEQMAWSDKKY
jgi:hypothetical protein